MIRTDPIVSQQRVVDGDLSQGQVGDMRSQQDIYVFYPANINQQSVLVQSGISTVYPDVKHVPPNTVTKQQYSRVNIQNTQKYTTTGYVMGYTQLNTG